MPAALPVSVVIPAYNAAAHLQEALASVRAQSVQPAEVVVVDDGSTDGTSAIARAAGARTLVQPNRGVASARNAGIRATAQPWIALLDADDRWEPERLAAQWALHVAVPEVALLATDYRYELAGAAPGAAVMASLPVYRKMRRSARAGGSLVARADLLEAILERNFVLPSSMLVARELFERDDAYFCERERLPAGPNFFVGEDYEWLLRALRFTDVLIVERALVAYRRGPATLSAHGGRLRYGDAVLAAFVAAAPERYPPGVAETLRRRRPAQLCDSGLRFLAGGDPLEARARFREALRAQPAPRSVLLALSTLPLDWAPGRRAFHAFYALWRERVRPLLRGRRPKA